VPNQGQARLSELSASLTGMSAQPAQEYNPDDPVQILRELPEQYREQFLAEYRAAVEGAQRVEGYRALHGLLRLWRDVLDLNQ
jgi:Family of unknown function (DUF6247)